MATNGIQSREQRRQVGTALGTGLVLAILASIYLMGICPAKRVLVPCVLSVVALAVVAAIFWLVLPRIDEGGARRVECLVFAALLVTEGMAYALFFPPGSVPDEVYHYEHAYMYANVLSGRPVAWVADSDRVLLTDHDLFWTPVDANHWASVQQSLGGTGTMQGEEAPDLLDGGQLEGADLPQTRLPGALGILVARLLGWGCVETFYLGRMFNMLCTCSLIALAAWLIPYGGTSMMVVALFPMTLHLMGSYSYDAPVIGLSFLLTSLLLRLACGRGRAGLRQLIAVAVVAALLAPCKIVYCPLVLIVLCVPRERFASKRVALAYKLGVLALAAASVLLVWVGGIAARVGGQTGVAEGLDVRGAETGTFYTITDLVTNPAMAIGLLARSVVINGDFYLRTMVGGSLGWFQANICTPIYLAACYLAILGFAGMPSCDDPAVVRDARFRRALRCIFAIVCVGVFMSMAVGWTFNTEDVISGVQGRYFLPVLPLIALGLRSRRLYFEGNSRAVCMGLASSVSFLNLACIAMLALTA